ncbi:MAG: hypothetical protein KatS3mg038_2164 [Candidatus Kapaibacterium sp.]|nr:MAG: hypothetical protein KatS3mg038_2164 [Candidatus Kapabacteria bacterium]
MYIVVYGDGRIVRCTTYADAVECLRAAQRSGDRYASVHGAAPHVVRTMMEDAGYTISASARECYEALHQHAQPVPHVDN